MRRSIRIAEVRAPAFKPGRRLRFAARRGDERSRYWTLRAAAKRPEVFIAPQGLGQGLHFSLHEDEKYWHYTIDLPGQRERRQWTPQKAFRGSRRALTIEIRPALIYVPIDDERDRTMLYACPEDPTNAVLIELHVVDAWQDNGPPLIRPLANGRGPVLMGGVRLVDGRSAALVASEWTPEEELVPVPQITDEMLARADGQSGTIGFVAFSTLSDGSLKIAEMQTDLRLEQARSRRSSPDL